jgi:hypothetical protein
LEENKASLEELKAAASATPKKEEPLEYTPHYDGHTHSPEICGYSLVTVFLMKVR